MAIGVRGRRGTRNAPSLVGAGRNRVFAWDGRRSSLEDQIRDAFLNPNELGLTRDELVRKLETKHEIDVPEALRALSAFVRSLDPGPLALERSRLGSAERRGLAIFEGRARCAACHSDTTSFTDQEFHRVDLETTGVLDGLADLSRRLSGLSLEERIAEISSNPLVAALGRFVVTLEPTDISTFRTPSLINVAGTRPYFHDGRAATLEEAVDREIYYRSDKQPLILNPAERSDLLAFLRSLTTTAETP